MQARRSTVSHPWRIGQYSLRFPADRVWTLGPPGYKERLPEATGLREVSGVVVVVALWADDILGRWEGTIETLRAAQGMLARETLVAVADPEQIPKGVLSMAEPQVQGAGVRSSRSSWPTPLELAEDPIVVMDKESGHRTKRSRSPDPLLRPYQCRRFRHGDVHHPWATELHEHQDVPHRGVLQWLGGQVHGPQLTAMSGQEGAPCRGGGTAVSLPGAT